MSLQIKTVWLGPSFATAPGRAHVCADSWSGDLEILDEKKLFTLVPWLYREPYFLDALKARHWAGASDIARLAYLCEHGGVYVDTDVRLVRRTKFMALAHAALASRTLVVGAEDETYYCGAVMIAPPRHQLIVNLLDTYRHTKFEHTFEGTTTGTTMLTEAVKRHLSNDVLVLPPQVFYPWHWREKDLDEEQQERRIEQPYVLTAHHWLGSWVK